MDLSSVSGKQYPTGISLLDDLLSGGLSSGSINEFIGFTSSGKTYLTQSICLQLIKRHDHFNALVISNSSQEGVSGSLRSILECQHLDNDVIIICTIFPINPTNPLSDHRLPVAENQSTVFRQYHSTRGYPKAPPDCRPQSPEYS